MKAKISQQEVKKVCFLDLGATSRATLENNEQDLEDTGELSRKTFLFSDGCTGKDTEKILLKHNLHLTTQETNIVPGLHSALVSVPK